MRSMFFENFLDQKRGQSQGGFIQHQHFGSRHQCPGDGDHLLLTSGAVTGQTVGNPGQAREMIVHEILVFADILGAVPPGDGSHPDILIHGKMLEYPAALRHHDRTEFHDMGTQNVGDVVSLEFDESVLDKTVFRFKQTADGPQGRGLAGPVGPQQGNNAALGHVQADAAQYLNNIVVDHFDVVDIEQIAVCFLACHKQIFLNFETLGLGYIFKGGGSSSTTLPHPLV